MGLLNFFKKSSSTSKQKKRYYGASNSNLFATWQTVNYAADAIIKKDLKALRARARELVRNNSHATKYIRLLQQNIIGNGIRLQNKAKDNNGSFDTFANSEIERKWSDFCARGNCEVTQSLDMVEVCKLVIATVATDGEVFIRKVRKYKNSHNFALQIIEADHLDEQYNDQSKNIVMGVEKDKYGKPIAYHLYKYNPNDLQNINRERVRIAADEIIHLYRKDRTSQSRGVTWLAPVMTDLKMYNGFAEAALVEKRLTASKMGFYKRPQGEEYYGDDVDENGNVINEATPGQFEILPDGWDFQSFDPKSGNDNFVDFGKAILRNIASGLGVSYNSLANDLEGVNYSSIRAGLIDERDGYKSLQRWFIEHFMKPIFKDWLEMQLLTQNINLPFAKFDKFNAPLFIPRSFAWVDPLKDNQANALAIKEGLKTATQVASEQGSDIEELYQQLAYEKELRKKYGITTESDVVLNQNGGGNETQAAV